MKIHSVVSGPYDDGDDLIWNVCKIEDEGEVYDLELYFDSFDDAYEMIKYFAVHIEPLELEQR